MSGEIKPATFKLHPALKEGDYAITNSLAEAHHWRARCLFANSGGDIGAMEEVGYVMISLTDDTIIPIARGDEHHKGYDALCDIAEASKTHLDPDKFVPVWCHGNNYVNELSEVPDLLTAIGKYLAYGGRDDVLVGAYMMRDQLVTLSSFVAEKGMIQVAPGRLAPLGKKVFDALKAAADATTEALHDAPRQKRAKAFAAARAALDLIERHSQHIEGAEDDAIKAGRAILKDASKNLDVDAVQSVLFGFDGIKRAIHMGVRQAIKDRSKKREAWQVRDATATWGDLDLANDMLGNL